MRQQRAFTLIELLVVFSILGLLVALVGPLGVRQMDKARAQEQWLVLQRTVEGLGFRAFVQGRELRLDANGTELTWQTGDQPPHVMVLDRLFFDPPQVVLINSHGLATPETLQVRQSGRARSLALNGWLQSGR
jgi:prepilin-type N-terminal cleavage/methylation domain-containing protein